MMGAETMLVESKERGSKEVIGSLQELEADK